MTKVMFQVSAASATGEISGVGNITSYRQLLNSASVTVLPHTSTRSFSDPRARGSKQPHLHSCLINVAGGHTLAEYQKQAAACTNMPATCTGGYLVCRNNLSKNADVKTKQLGMGLMNRSCSVVCNALKHVSVLPFRVCFFKKILRNSHKNI